jgi:DNA (cytosine-5)-methyltransferase 1
MIYGSVCSGIEAATMAWHPLGWQPAFVSEIEKFPRALLRHHYPHVPNHGDMTKFQEWPDHAIDLLVGGTPCQSFSVAGLRAGLADPRGNLMLTYLAIAARYRPRWLVWENVPGVLSSNGGRDFGTLLRGLAELGYGFAYRVLDAQFCRAHGYEWAVPQRRRRVFVVGYLGDWRRAAAVLFDGTSLRGDPAPRRGARKDVAPTISSRPTGGGGLGTDFDLDGGLIADVCGTLNNSGGNAYPGQTLQDATSGQLIAFGGNNTSGPIEVATALNAKSTERQDFETETFVAFAQNQRDEVRQVIVAGALAAEPGMKQQTYLAHAIQAGATRTNPESGPDGVGVQTDLAYTLEARPEVQAVAWSIMPQNSGKDYKARAVEVAQPVMAGGPVGGNQGGDYIQEAWAVRRLTPRECERLQGFPDDFTAIPYRGKPAADGPRYKALGNSMAVNVMRVIGTRIAMLDALDAHGAAA